MKGFAKGFTLCLLLLCLLVTTVSAASVEDCPGDCRHQAAIGTTHYDTLEEAITAAKEGSVITLLTDIPTQKALSIDKKLTLDLGGKTLSGKNSANESLLKVSADFVLRNGTMTTNAGVCLQAEHCNLVVDDSVNIQAAKEAVALIFKADDPVIMRQQNDEIHYSIAIRGKLSSEGSNPAIYITTGENFAADITIEKTASVTAKKSSALQITGNGKLIINGGTFRAKEHAVALEVPEKGNFAASVTDGKFTTKKETFAITWGKDAIAPGNFVTGGTFNLDPSGYIPSYCSVINNPDGTYTVISGYILTFNPNGGSGTMNSIRVACGQSVKLPECGFTAPHGSDFKGWEINGVTYPAGSSYTPTGNTIVKALWGEHVHTGGKATCLQKAVCSGCGEEYGMFGSHSLYSAGGYAATCTSDGMNAHSKCSVCGKRFVNGETVSLSDLVMPALGHLWQPEAGKPADCQNDGILAHKRCVNCGQLQADDKPITEEELVIPAGGHTLESVEKIDATCTQSGILAHDHCTVCDLLFVNNKPVEAAELTTATASHVLSDWCSDETGHWKTCVDCGEEFRRGSHKLSDGECTDCGYAAANAEDTPDQQQEKNFSWLFLIPVVAAVGIAGALIVSIVLKRRK